MGSGGEVGLGREGLSPTARLTTESTCDGSEILLIYISYRLQVVICV